MIFRDCDFLPFSYLEGFFRILSERDDIEVMTYKDISFPSGSSYEDYYQEEFREWKRTLSKSKSKSEKVYVFIQHDVDRYPERTHRVLELQSSLHLRSSTLVFNKMIDRRLLRTSGEVVEKDYLLDFERLKELEAEGFAFGYHSNAYERSGFSLEDAREIFTEDVLELRKKLNIEFFSPHGGVRDADGHSNSIVTPPVELGVKWVQNRFSLRFDGYFSDGGLNGKRDPNGRDLRDFVKRFERGKRYRLLLHPQYYNNGASISNRLMEANWYRDIVESKYKSWQALWANAK